MTEEKGFLSSIKARYLRHIVQAQVMIVMIYAVSHPQIPVFVLWRIDPLLSFGAALSGEVIALGFIILAIAMLVLAAILGRAFCGWVCPIGFLQDLTSYGTNKKWMPESLRYVKYALLIGGLGMAAVSGWNFLHWITPLSMFPRGISPVWEWFDTSVFGLSILLLALGFSAVTEKRAWCRYVCPLGAMHSLPSGFRAVGIDLDRDKCIKCMKCEKACTMGIIDIKGQWGLRWDSECIDCLSCRDVCPVDAINLSTRF